MSFPRRVRVSSVNSAVFTSTLPSQLRPQCLESPASRHRRYSAFDFDKTHKLCRPAPIVRQDVLHEAARQSIHPLTPALSDCTHSTSAFGILGECGLAL